MADKTHRLCLLAAPLLIQAVAFAVAGPSSAGAKPTATSRPHAPFLKTPVSPMALIAAGAFQMGSDGEENPEENEFPRHRVWLDAFYIDKYEVSVAQYRLFSKATGKRLPPQPENSKDSHPVLVPWLDAQAYCKWAGKRLPYEAEYEKAARGGVPAAKTRFKRFKLFGERIDAHCEDCARPTGESVPNQYGLYDMNGNAWEWCADWYEETYYQRSPDVNPKGPDTGISHVLRGGDLHQGTGVRVSRPSARLAPWLYGGYGYGFRCAKNAEAL